MIQVYFLCVVFNILAGFALVGTKGNPSGSAFDGIRDFFKDETVRLALGILTLVAGILKVLSSIRGDIPVLGDLVPALLGGMAGFTLMLEFYRAHTTVANETLDKLEATFLKNGYLVGLGSLVSGIVHFFIPTVLFL